MSGCNTDSGASELSVFRYNQASGITSLDPAFAKDQANIWVVHQMFNGLIQLDEALEIQPCIARRWEVSDDGRTYRFYLREDVRFHNHDAFEDGRGRRVTAADFVYSFQRLLDPDVASPGGWVFRERVTDDNPFRALSDTVLEIHLTKSFPPFLSLLSMQYCSVVPQEVVQHYGKDFRKNPVGTGPFRFKLWDEGEVLVMRRNDHYFEQDNSEPLPYLDAIQVTFQEDRQLELLNLSTGKLHLVSGLHGDYKDEVLTKAGKLQPKYADRFNLMRSPYLNTEYLGFRLDPGKGRVVKRAVRQAINYGFNRARMIKYLRNNVGVPAHGGFVPPTLLDEPVEGYRYDPKKAARLLKKAGHPDGKDLKPIKLYTNPTYRDLCAFIQRELQELGIALEMEVTQPGTLREWMATGKVAFFRGSWIADYPDAESYLTVFYGPHPAPPNYTTFRNARYDSLYEVAMQETDIASRRKLYRQMDQLLIEEAPIVPLYYDEVLRFVRKEVKGLSVNAMNLLDLKRVRIGEVKEG